MRVETDLADPETINLIQKVLDEFDASQEMDEDEAMFATRFQVFEGKNQKKDNMMLGEGRVRNKATKRVSEAYNLERMRNEKEEEKRLLEVKIRSE